MANSPLRVGFVLRSFTYGGAEHDVIQLITRSDRAELQCVGMVVQTHFPLCPDLPLDHSSVPLIYQPDAVSQHPKVIGDLPFAAAVARVAEQADVLITWGVPNLDEALPQTFRGQVVATSKSSGTFQESFLHANALLTRDYVANSLKSVEGFPEAVRDRVEVIYTGVDAHRLASTRSREDVRREWGLEREDRVVGYLGRIAEDKGVERVVEAVRELDPRWKAVFVGRTGNFPDYERQFEQLCRERLPGRHHLAGWRTDVGNVLRAMDVLVYPSDDEGFANSLAESWLVGVPTLATEGVGAMAEDPWRDCSITVRPHASPSELRASIEEAFGNVTLVKRARRIAAPLKVERTIAAWQNYLSRVVRGSRRTRVMVLLPNLMIGGMQSWLLTLMRHTPQIDWVCLCVVSETADFEGDRRLAQDIQKRGCPIVGIPALPDQQVQSRLQRAMRQTRPDVVLQAGVRNLDRTYPDTTIPLVAVSHGPGESAWGRSVLVDSCRRATECVAVSTSAAQAYGPDRRRRVRVIPNGVEPPPSSEVRAAMRAESRQQLGLDVSEIAVGFLGRLSPEKNPTMLARAVAELPDHYCAVFVGPAAPDVLAEIDRITKRFRHVPGVRPAETGQWLAALDVLVCPSEFESFGLAIVEAWTFGVPVVATPVGVVKELQDVAEVAVTVPHTASPADWAVGIRQALKESARRSSLCRRLAHERFHSVRMGEQWQQLLQSLTGHESAGSRSDGLQAAVRSVPETDTLNPTAVCDGLS